MTCFSVIRTLQTETATLGELWHGGSRLCATLEDLPRPQKVPGATRIPAGTYRLSLVHESGFNYRAHKIWQRLGGEDWHRGIINVCEVPGFSLIRWHWGNDHRDTAGCLLLGETATPEMGGYLFRSREAYQRVYPIVRDLIEAGETQVTYHDEGCRA